jgi:NADPH2:quinone reductase
MKAWLLDSIGGGIEQLRLADAPDPKPQAGDVLLDVRYAALNPADRYLAEGQYPARPALPHILGRDGVGTVRALGPGVSNVKIGDTLTILRGETGVSKPGTFAERVCVAADYLVPTPTGWTLQQAACAGLVYITAYQALTQWGELPPSVVLITGASGGVGVASTQLACAIGHTVIALSRSAEKQAKLNELGADCCVDPHDPQWRQRVKEFLGGKRVDLAVDNIGGPLFNDVLDTLGLWGKVSVVGRLAGPVPTFNTASLFFRRIRIGGVAVGSYTNAESRAAWNEILRLLGKTGATPLIDRVFPFEQLPAAFARLAEGPMGKVLLKVRLGN